MGLPLETIGILSASLVILAGWIVHHFSSPGTSCLLKLAVIVSFALGFGGIALLPIDLTITRVFEEGEGTDQPPNATYSSWQVTYWSTFLLGYGALPLLREAILSGQFTIQSRFREGCRRAVRLYVIMLVVAVTAVLVLAIKLHNWHVVPVLMALGNTYGLLMVMLLLGYGLVDVPRHMWRKADPQTELRRKQIMASNADEALFDAVWELQDCEDLVDAAAAMVGDTTEDGIRPHLDLNYMYCLDKLLTHRKSTAVLSPELQRRRASTNHRRHEQNAEMGGTTQQLTKIPNGDDTDEAVSCPTLEYLASLNARLEAAQAGVVIAEQQWNSLVSQSNLYTHLADGTVPPPDPIGVPTLEDSFCTKLRRRLSWMGAHLSYWWLTCMRSPVLRVFSSVAAALSVAVMWSEATLAIPFNLSPFSLVLRMFDKDGDKGLLFQIAAMVPLLYIATCVYSSLFKLSLFGRYRLRGHKQSEGVALVFNAQYLVRLQFPLAYNYLLMIKYDTSTTDCAFSQVMSNMSTVPFLGTSFSVYAPLLILALCGFTLCNGYGRLLAMLGIEHEDSILSGDRETLDGKVNEGIMLLRRHSQKRQSPSNATTSFSKVESVDSDAEDELPTKSSSGSPSWRTGIV